MSGFDGFDGFDAHETELADAMARELESLGDTRGVTPSPEFTDKVMAAIAAEPSPQPVAAFGAAISAGRATAALAAIRDSWRVAFGGARPLAVRAQAFALVLLVAIGALGVTSASVAGAAALLGNQATPSPSVPPSPSPSPSPTATPSPRPSATPSPTPSATATDTAEPMETAEPTDDHGGGSGSGGGGSGSGGDSDGGSGSSTPQPAQTVKPTGTPQPSDGHGGNSGPGGGGSGSDDGPGSTPESGSGSGSGGGSGSSGG